MPFAFPVLSTETLTIEIPIFSDSSVTLIFLFASITSIFITLSLIHISCKNAVNGYATIFGYRVKDPCRFGIMEIDKNKKVLSVEEKPDFPKSDICITGLYFYDRCVCEFASSVEPSGRGEFEITSLNRIYMQNEKLKAEMLGRGCKWYDTGTPESLYEAGKFIRSIENKRGEMLYICLLYTSLARTTLLNPISSRNSTPSKLWADICVLACRGTFVQFFNNDANPIS